MSYRPDVSMTAPIVEWDDRKGFGFLQVGKGRLFLHRRDFAEYHKRPQVGDIIRFKVGADSHGRTCAREASHINDGGRFTGVSLVVLAGLLLLPLLALCRSGMDWRWSGGWALGISLVSYISYAVDKSCARQGRWRISEAGLHLTELLGGWPGAFIAQRRLRHKVSKVGYQCVFWLIVLTYQLIAFDAVLGWKLCRAAWQHSYLR